MLLIETITHKRTNIVGLDPDRVRKELTGRIEIIDGSNVAELSSRTETLNWANGLPNCAPPFPTFWIESQNRNASPHYPRAWGHLFVAHDVSSVDKGGPGATSGLVREDTQWLLDATLFIEVAAHTVIAVSKLQGSVNAGGQLGGYFVIGELPVDRAIREFTILASTELIYPHFLTICFMHAKNIVLESHRPTDQNRAFRRSHGLRPPMRFHTLRLHPGQTITRSDPNLELTGQRNALHICRGHFKTFTAERPLLGKHTGTFWWPQQARGSLSEGRIIKRYAVDP
jgi:hypothetical protein